MHLKSNTSIELLPENIIDQIKAGEVIEGPANILKELLENSIDANSKSIDVHIENNGLDLIAVCDDGIGITKEDLPLAFHRHATSKLSNFEDLFKLYSYGFRGEALASIASISKISCETIHIKGQHSLFTIEGGRVMAHVCLSQHSQQKAGTKIFVKDLFFNTPVRVKFLRSQQALRNSLKRIMDAFLLAAPEIKFTCRWDNKDKQMFFAETGEDSLFNRVGQLFKIDKRKLKDSLLVSEQSYDDYHLKIYIDKKFTKGFANKKQYILVNNRSIEDKKLHNILLQYLQPLWPQGHSGNYVIKIDLPPDHLDVNVHPQKSCIRFYKSSDVHALLIATVKQLTKNIASNEQSSTTFNPRVDLNTDVSNFKQRYLEDSFAPQSSPSSLLSFDWDYNFLLPFNSSVYG
ncbi:MAG: DNA mismatch repair endonuclease MutL, partial [Bacteriovoracia bacterium]